MNSLTEEVLQEKIRNVQEAFLIFSNEKTLKNAQALSDAESKLCAYVIGVVK